MNPVQAKWVLIGPPEIGIRVPTFTFIPGRSQELIVGTRPDGFYRVDTNCEQWTKIEVGCQFTLGFGPNLHSIAISPHDHSHILIGMEQLGIMRSIDAGDNWCFANTGLRGKETWSLNGICFSFHPQDKRLVFYGSDGGLYRSVDGGQTWTYVQEGLPPVRRSPKLSGKFDTVSIWKIDVHKAIPERIYAGIMSAPPDMGAGMYVSYDDGESWRACSVGLPENNNHRGVLDFAISDSNPEIIFAGCRKGLFATRDSGQSWNQCGNFQKGVYAICLHPYDTNTLYAGLDDGSVHISTNSGLGWHEMSEGLPVGIKAEPITIEFQDHDGSKEVRREYRWSSVISKLGISSEMPDDLYAATPFGLYKCKIN